MTITLTAQQKIDVFRQQQEMFRINRQKGKQINPGTAREDLGMTQSELAELCGCSRVYISKLERDAETRRSISLGLAHRISMALDYPMELLFAEAVEEEN